MLSLKSIFGLILIYLLFYCSLEPQNNEVTVETDSQNYNWSLTDSIPIEVTNNNDRSIYFLCSGDIYLEEHLNNEIIDTWKVHGFEKCLAASPIQSKSKKVFTVYPHSEQLSNDSIITYQISSESEYKFRVNLFFDKNFEDMVPIEQCRSNSVKLE